MGSVKILANRQLFILFFLLSFLTVHSQVEMPFQHFSITGRVYGVDEFDTVPYALVGASATLSFTADSTLVQTGYTTAGGKLSLKAKNNTIHKDIRSKLTVSYVGMDSKTIDIQFKRVPFPGDTEFYNASIDSIVLVSRPVTTEEVVIIGQLRKMYEEGDTTIFNVEAFEMPSGSVLLELVRRLPGLLYEDGHLTYNGKDIREIRLNGESFFKHDIKIALENMPNERLKQLKVYETPDDTTSQFSNKHLVMDMVTDKPVSKTLFANASASAKADPIDYKIKADVSKFKMKGPQFNAMLNFGSLQIPPHKTNDYRERYLGGSFANQFKRFRLDVMPAVYRYDNEDDNYILSQQNLDGLSMTTEEENHSKSSRWGFNTGMPITLQGQLGTDWTWRTSLSVRYEHESVNQSVNRSTIQQTEELSELQEVNQSTSKSFRKNIQRLLNWEGSLTKRLNPIRAEMRLEMGAGGGNNDSYLDDQNMLRYTQLTDSSSFYHRHTENTQDQLSYTVAAHFKQAFGQQHNWSVSYRWKGNVANGDYDYFDILAMPESKSMTYNNDLQRVDSLSFDFTSRQHAHIVNADLHFQWNKISAAFNIGTAPTHLKMHHRNTRINRDEWLNNGSAMLRYMNGAKGAEIRYDLSEQMPSAMNLIDVYNAEDPLNRFVGNGRLKKLTLHQLTAGVNLPHGFSASNKTRWIHNDLGRSTIYDKSTGQRTSTIRNVNGNWQNDVQLSWDGLIGNVRANLGFDYRYWQNAIQVGYDDGPFQDAKTYDNHFNFNLRLNYGSKWMTTAFNGQYAHIMRNSIVSKGNVHRNELTLVSNSSFNTPFGLTLLPVINYTLRGGYESEAMNRSEFVCNIGASYSFWRRIITLRLDVNDIFDQSKNMVGMMDETVWTEKRDYCQNRYLLLTVSVKLSEIK